MSSDQPRTATGQATKRTHRDRLSSSPNDEQPGQKKGKEKASETQLPGDSWKGFRDVITVWVERDGELYDELLCKESLEKHCQGRWDWSTDGKRGTCKDCSEVNCSLYRQMTNHMSFTHSLECPIICPFCLTEYKSYAGLRGFVNHMRLHGSGTEGEKAEKARNEEVAFEMMAERLEKAREKVSKHQEEVEMLPQIVQHPTVHPDSELPDLNSCRESLQIWWSKPPEQRDIGDSPPLRLTKNFAIRQIMVDCASRPEKIIWKRNTVKQDEYMCSCGKTCGATKLLNHLNDAHKSANHVFTIPCVICAKELNSYSGFQTHLKKCTNPALAEKDQFICRIANCRDLKKNEESTFRTHIKQHEKFREGHGLDFKRLMDKAHGGGYAKGILQERRDEYLRIFAQRICAQRIPPPRDVKFELSYLTNSPKPSGEPSGAQDNPSVATTSETNETSR